MIHTNGGEAMSEELRAASERMRAYLADKEARVDSKHPYGVNYWAGGWYFNNEQYRRDGLMLRDAYLAEHPADDDEPAADDWQMSIGLSEDRVMVEWNGLHGDVITWIDGNDLSSARPPWNTRGDVRRLLAALGIEVRK